MNSNKGLVAGLGVAALTVIGVACGSGELSTTRDTSSSAAFFKNASGNTVASQANNELDTEPDVVRQDESAALETDTALAARQLGLPAESVERAIEFQQAFGKYVDELIVRFPDQISAVWTEPVPNARGHVRFTGEVPPEVTAEIERQGLLDPNNVVIAGGGLISMADHSRRSELAHEALVDLGYRNFMTAFDPIDNVISIELQLPEGASRPSKLDLVGAVRDRVRAERYQSGEARFQGRASTVDALDLELTIITGSGPIITLEPTRGGIVEDQAGVAEAVEGPSAPADTLPGTSLSPSPRPSHGSPPPPSASSPGPSLKFEGVDYVHSGYAEPADGGQVFFIDGTEVHVDNLEVVGRTTEGNTHGIQDSLQVYRHKGLTTNDVYTFRQGEDHVNPEDGQIFKGRDGWTYWTPQG